MADVLRSLKRGLDLLDLSSEAEEEESFADLQLTTRLELTVSRRMRAWQLVEEDAVWPAVRWSAPFVPPRREKLVAVMIADALSLVCGARELHRPALPEKEERAEQDDVECLGGSQEEAFGLRSAATRLAGQRYCGEPELRALLARS